MPLGPFPDPRQIKVLSFLDRNYGGSSKPVGGRDGLNISSELGITYDELRPLISDLEERGYVRTGCKTRGNIIGRVAISSAGRDFLNGLPPDRAAETEATARKKAEYVFLVQGRDKVLNDYFRDMLRSMGLWPIPWEEAVRMAGEAKGTANPYMGDIVTIGIDNAVATLVLLSPDDVAYLRPHCMSGDETDNPAPQPRPNVLYEAGIAMKGRPEKTVLVKIGQLRDISDIHGRYEVRFDGSYEKCTELREILRGLGCEVSPSTEFTRFADGRFPTPKDLSAGTAPFEHPPNVSDGTTRPTAAPFFKMEYSIDDLKEAVRNSSRMYFWGTSFETHIPLLKGEITRGLRRGLQTRFLLIAPRSSAVKMAAFRANETEGHRDGNLRDSLAILSSLTVEDTAGHLECRVVDYLAPYTMYLIEPDQDSGYLLVRLSTFRPEEQDWMKRPTFILTRKDDRFWFDHFVNQFEVVWHNAEKWEPA